jgi:hypothetical protein
VDFLPVIPFIAILLDVVVLSAFIYIKYLNDPLVLIVAAIGIVLIFLAERLFMISHTDSEGNMPMGMDKETIKEKM